jgi:DNA repair exonuclease SbcCD ATPase subunit
MSTFTKILIIIIFVMSLVYLGVSATLFSLRVDYKSRLEKETKAHEESNQNAKKKIDGLTSEISTKNIEIQRLQNELIVTQNELTNTYSSSLVLEKKFTDLLNDINELRKRYETLAANLEEQTKKNNELQTLLDEHRKNKEQAESDRDTIQAKFIETEDKLVKAEKNLAELEQQYVAMAKDLNYSKTELDFYRKKVPNLKPIGPVEPIEGKVLAVSNQYDLVVISVGKKDKVDVGVEFTVYRGNKFIGKVKVEKVDNEWSSAMSLKEFTVEKVQVGDNVSTQVY